MVFTLPVRRRTRFQALILSAALAATWTAVPVRAYAVDTEGPHDRGEGRLLPDESVQRAPAAQSTGDFLRDAQTLYRSGHYFKAARYAFAASESASQNDAAQAEAYSWVTLGLIRAGLYHSASYFFIRTLQTGHQPSIRRVLSQTQDLLLRVGADLFRKYLIQHTTYDDYDSLNRSAYLYALGKDALLEGQEERAIGYLSSMTQASPLWPFALQLRGSAYAIRGRMDDSVRDFEQCVAQASNYVGGGSTGTGNENLWRTRQRREAEDLQARCIAGQARVLYERDRFAEADRVFDRIAKSSIVWPDILFEQAWNSFGRQEYNRTLGKLVSYKSPALRFVFNSEVDVLRAQSYLALCLYTDANEVINEFNTKYTRIGEELKRFITQNVSNLNAFYEVGTDALRAPLQTRNDFHRLLNRFVRSPYFQNLVSAESAVAGEAQVIRRFDSLQAGVAHDPGAGFPGFLAEVLKWRKKSVRMMGGAFVKNSLLDHHSILIADFEKMAFIKLEMLSRAKDRLLYKQASSGDRSRGSVRPSRRDDQYYWSFNGEFWNDELGDYVFGLESECQ